MVKSVPKITGFLGTKTTPNPMSEDEVQRIFKQLESETKNATSSSLYNVGDKIQVIDGPFDSFSGFVEEIDVETQRLKILTENWQHIETLDNSAFRFVFSRDQKTALDFNALAIFIFCAVIVTKRFILGIMTLGIYFFTYYLNCLYSYTWQGTEYMEMYGRLIFFGMLVSLFILSVKTRINQVFFWGLCILCFMAFFDKTHHVKHEFTDRYQEINRRTQDSKFDKICIQNDSLWIKKIWFSWAMPHESLLVSTLEGHSKTIYIANGSKLQLVDIKKNHLNGSLRNFSKTELARTYFRNLDTSEYQLLLK